MNEIVFKQDIKMNVKNASRHETSTIKLKEFEEIILVSFIFF